MRGLPHQGASDSLRPDLNNEFNNNAPRPKRVGPLFRHAVTGLLLATLSYEASSFHEHENPHGNRRERIEEMRQRLLYNELHSRGLRNANLGGNGGGPDPEPETDNVITTTTRRRTVAPGLDT